MRKKYYIIFILLSGFFAWNGTQACAQEIQKTHEIRNTQGTLKTQETLKLAPNNIPKGMTTDKQRSAQDAEKKLVEYQRNYFLKKHAPFRRRTSIGQGGYYSFEIDSLARYYENMVSAEHFQKKDYRILKDYIDRGIPVLVNVRYTGAVRGLRPGPRGHWMVLRGIDDKHVWVNDPGRSPEMRNKGENICYPIKKQPGNPSYFDGCWTGRFIVVTPKEWIRNSLFAQVGKLPPLEEVTYVVPPFVSSVELPRVISQ